MTEYRSFGYWVRRRRKALDLTQAELGRRTGASAAMIRKIEADERRPSLELARLLAVELSVPIAERDAFLRAARDASALEKIPLATSPLAHQTLALPAPSNLPASMTSLVDRINALTEVATLLQRSDVRLVTLIGPPGIGKTRLSTQAGRQLLPYFRNGSWFVDLSATSDPKQMMPAITLALALPPAPGLFPKQQVLTALKDQQLLLILDNLEQLVEGAALDVAELLRACPGVKVLATSRVRLDVYGEHEYLLSPMTLPPPGEMHAPAELQKFEAVQLFLERVQQHQPDFELTPVTAVPVVEICRQMDGLPLALELAAARTRSMTIAALADALRDASGRDWHALLYSSARDLPRRQQTLFAAVAWSYSLLAPRDQLVLRQLAVFRGSFDVAAAVAVCLGQHSVDTGWVIGALERLQDHNLISPVSRDPQRWRLLELVREYALSQQDEPEWRAARDQHARHFAVRRRDWYTDWSEPDTLAAVDTDLENYRAAFQEALEQRDALLAHQLAALLGNYHERRGQLGEGRSLLRQVLDLPGPIDPHVRFPALHQVAVLAWMQRDFAAAERYSAMALDLTRDHELPAKTTVILNMLGRIYLEQGRYEEADRVLLEAIELSHTMSPPQPASMEIIQRGEVALAQGRLEDAAMLTHTGLDGFSETALIPFCMGWTNLAEVALARGDAQGARAALEKVRPLAHLHTRRARLWLTAVAGYLLMAERSPAEPEVLTAVRLLAAITAANERQGDPLSPMTQAQTLARNKVARARLAPAAWQVAWDEGLCWTLPEAIGAANEALQENP